MRTKIEIKGQIKNLERKYRHCRHFIAKHKVLGDKKKSVARCSAQCPILISAINGLHWVLGEERITTSEVKALFEGRQNHDIPLEA